MRFALSAPLLLSGSILCAQMADAAVRLDLPPGPLSVALAQLGQQAHINIGTTDRRLMSTLMPGLHCAGSWRSVLERVARAADARAVQLSQTAWQLEARPRVAHSYFATAPSPPDTIVVNGSKRDEPLADEAADVVRVDGTTLEDFGAHPDTQSLAEQIPTLISTHWGDGQDKLFLRGIADSSFAGSSPALVGQYFGDQRLTFNAPDPDLRLYDIAGVEVMEGPQGTLYGAGALGGLIRVEPRLPDLERVTGALWSGVTTVAHGGSGTDSGAVLNLPLVAEQLGLRLLAYDSFDPGYIDDTGRNLRNVNRSRTLGGRAGLRWRVGGGWTFDLGTIVQRIDNRDAPYADLGAPTLTRSSNVAQPSSNQFVSGSLAITGMLGNVRMVSTTGIVKQSFDQQFEVPTVDNSYQFTNADRTSLITQELRFSRSAAAMSWVLGVAYLSNIDHDARSYGIRNKYTPLIYLTNRARDVTAYGEATQHLSTRLAATIGLRFTTDHLTGAAIDLKPPFHVFVVQPLSAARNERHLLPSLAISYRIATETTGFVRYEQGFRPGGLTNGEAPQRFASDQIRTVEAGLRHGAADRSRFSFSLTAATSRWDHIQADVLGGLGLPYIANIGDGHVNSLDASMTLHIRAGWKIAASAFMARGRLYRGAGLAVVDLPNVVHDGERLVLEHVGHLVGATWRTTFQIEHVGPSIFGVGSELAVPQGRYATVAIGSDLTLGRAHILIDVTNLLDSHADIFAVGTPFASLATQQVTPLQPRTVRMGLRYNF